MNSTLTVPVTSQLIEEALECYWRSIAMIKPNEETTIIFDKEGMMAVLTTTKEVVEVFRI